MISLLETVTQQTAAAVTVGISVLLLTFVVHISFQRSVLHPLASFPGPRIAALTAAYKAYVECISSESWHIHLGRLHAKYGSVVRVGPNELHFSDPNAYHDIYNNQNRWDKEESLYHSFGEDRSSFGFLTYQESRKRKDVLNKSFSQRAISRASGLVQNKVDSLCDAFKRASASSTPVDLALAFRCMTMDIITSYSFGASINAISTPNFAAPIILAMDASVAVFVRFKHSSFYKNMILNCPPAIARIVASETAGLIDLQEIIQKQIAQITRNQEKELALLPHDQTIYHHLLDQVNHEDGRVPDAGSLYEETQALMFAGADTVGHTLMVGTFHIARDAAIAQRLRVELEQVLPDPDSSPDVRELEKLPYLNAVIKEALRLNCGVIAGLPRIVPPTGAHIAGHQIPAGAIVSIGSTFVHYNEQIFKDAKTFRPERWLEDPGLDNWLISFSRGPRACLGINLAWTELRLAFASVHRRFDITLDDRAPEELVFEDAFLPHFVNERVLAKLRPVAD